MEITITVPLNEKALRDVATKLTGIANQLATPVAASLPAAAIPPMPTAVPPPPPPAPPATPSVVAATGPLQLSMEDETDKYIADVSVPLDTEGLPWDERIHSSTKSKYAKDNAQTGTVGGGWKRKRGVQPLTIDEVKAELRIAYPAPVTPAPLTAPAAPPTAPITPDGNLYLPLMQKCTQRIGALELTLEDIVAVCQRHGVARIELLTGRPDLIPTVEAEIEAIWIRNTQK